MLSDIIDETGCKYNRFKVANINLYKIKIIFNKMSCWSCQRTIGKETGVRAALTIACQYFETGILIFPNLYYIFLQRQVLCFRSLRRVTSSLIYVSGVRYFPYFFRNSWWWFLCWWRHKMWSFLPRRFPVSSGLKDSLVNWLKTFFEKVVLLIILKKNGVTASLRSARRIGRKMGTEK